MEMTFGERLRIALEGRSVAEFARLTGIGESLLRKYLSDDSEPTVGKLQMMRAHLTVAFDWLVAEVGPKWPTPGSEGVSETGHVAREDRGSYIASRREFMELPLYDIAAGAGSGKWNDDARVKSWLSFRRDWLSQLVGAANGLSLITVDGDSMEPTLKSGAVVMVRDIETFNFSDGIYFMLLNGRHVIKRIQRKSLQMIENGQTQLNITVVSDNDAYAPIDVTLRNETLNETTVLARAVWLGVKLP